MQNETDGQKLSSIYSEFAYDDAFRTMETECDDIVIPFVNYFYKENYDNTAKIIRLRNEHFIEHEDQSDEKRITDSRIRITQNGVSKTYHFEREFNEINSDDNKTEALVDVFRNIIERMDDELEKGNLSALSYDAIIRLTHKVIYKLTSET